MKNTNKESTQYYPLTDLGNSAALIEAGFELASLDKSDPHKVRFIFKGKEGITQIQKDYYDKKLKVDALGYFNTIKNLKNQIHSN